MSQKLCLQMIIFFLMRPFLTTALFSVFVILFIIILSAAFIILMGVLVIAIIILLCEGEHNHLTTHILQAQNLIHYIASHFSG